MATDLSVFREQQSEAFKAEFATLIDQLAGIRRKSRLFGDTETLRSSRFQIIYRLNEMCLSEIGTSFTELNQKNGWDV